MADMTFAVTISGNISGKRFGWTKTATVADVDDVMQAFCESGGGEPNFFSTQGGSYTSSTMHTYTGMAAVMVVGQNIGGVNLVSLVGAIILSTYLTPAGFPFIAYNGGGFNGMFNSGNTATDVPDEDPESYASGAYAGGRSKFSAIGALKAIS